MLFQELSASKWRTWWSRWSYCKRTGLKSELWNSVKLLTRARCAVSKSCSRLLLLVFQQLILGTDGGLEVKNRKITRAWWRWNLWAYFGSDKEKTGEAFEVVDFWREPGVLFGLYPWGCRFLISAWAGFCYFLCGCLLRLFCRKAWLLILKSLRSWLVW